MKPTWTENILLLHHLEGHPGLGVACLSFGQQLDLEYCCQSGNGSGMGSKANLQAYLSLLCLFALPPCSTKQRSLATGSHDKPAEDLTQPAEADVYLDPKIQDNNTIQK